MTTAHRSPRRSISATATHIATFGFNADAYVSREMHGAAVAVAQMRRLGHDGGQVARV